MTVLIVYEENHGTIFCAKDFNAAKRALLETDWVNGSSDVWCPDMREEVPMDAGSYRSLEEMYGENWKDVFLSDIFDDILGDTCVILIISGLPSPKSAIIDTPIHVVLTSNPNIILGYLISLISSSFFFLGIF